MENLGTTKTFILNLEGFELYYLAATDEIISAIEPQTNDGGEANED